MSDRLTMLKHKLDVVKKQKEKWYHVCWKSARNEDLQLYKCYLNLEEHLKEKIEALEYKKKRQLPKPPASALLSIGLSGTITMAHHRKQ